MYPFIKELHEQYRITLEDIHEIEKQFDVVFPEDMKEYYLAYNGASTVLSFYDMDVDDDGPFDVHGFYSIKHPYPPYPAGVTVERVLWGDRMDCFIPANMLPFVYDQGGDRYYCDCRTGEVLCFRSDDIDNPEWVCGSFKELIENLTPYK